MNRVLIIIVVAAATLAAVAGCQLENLRTKQQTEFQWLVEHTRFTGNAPTEAEYLEASQAYRDLIDRMSNGKDSIESYAINTLKLFKQFEAEFQKSGGYQEFCSKYGKSLAAKIVIGQFLLIYSGIVLDSDYKTLPNNLKADYFASAKNCPPEYQHLLLN